MGNQISNLCSFCSSDSQSDEEIKTKDNSQQPQDQKAEQPQSSGTITNSFQQQENKTPEPSSQSPDPISTQQQENKKTEPSPQSQDPISSQQQENKKTDPSPQPSNPKSKPTMSNSCKEQLLHGHIRICVNEAKNLPDTDSVFWNKSKKDVTDPFVQGDLGDVRLFKTKHINNDLNPRWGEVFHFNVNQNAKNMVISVLDKDSMGDDVIGNVTISAEDLLNKKMIGGSDGDWFPIMNNDKAQGEINLSIKFTSKDPLDDKEHLLHGRIRICINEAKDLPDTDNAFWNINSKDVTDPFVHGEIGEARLFKTDYKNNTLTPSYEETFNVHVCHSTKSVDITVQDKDCLGKQIIGVATFPSKDLLKEELIGGHLAC